LRDGTNYQGECRITKGEPSNPHTADDLRGKFLELGEQVWGRATTQSLFASLMQLEDIPDFARFADTLTL
jgi:hypothetical protein